VQQRISVRNPGAAQKQDHSQWWIAVVQWSSEKKHGNTDLLLSLGKAEQTGEDVDGEMLSPAPRDEASSIEPPH
jgi:hypothetical protein